MSVILKSLFLPNTFPLVTMAPCLPHSSHPPPCICCWEALQGFWCDMQMGMDINQHSQSVKKDVPLKQLFSFSSHLSIKINSSNLFSICYVKKKSGGSIKYCKALSKLQETKKVIKMRNKHSKKIKHRTIKIHYIYIADSILIEILKVW